MSTIESQDAYLTRQSIPSRIESASQSIRLDSVGIAPTENVEATQTSHTGFDENNIIRPTSRGLTQITIRPTTQLTAFPVTETILERSAAASIRPATQISVRPNSDERRSPTKLSVYQGPSDFASRKASQASAYSAKTATYIDAASTRKSSQASQFSNVKSIKSIGVENRIAHDLIELLKTSGATPQDITRSITQLSQSNMISATLLSEIEAAILRSSEPVQLNETDEIEVLGQRGIWANKAEVLNWRGVIPISEYLINEDANPEVITKRSQQILEYLQEIAIRYLRPPTPPAPGEIVITQEQNILTPPAPPLVIRQQPARPETPEPLVIREAPPQPPQPVGRKIITISGKRLPPAPRKVVIERFAELPAKPQSVLIERWLPYSEVKRRVIFKAAPPDPVIVKPRNTIVQWEAPEVHIRKELKYLGIVKANPAEYVRTYNETLRVTRDLPDFVFDIKHPDGLVLAADYKAKELHELEGDLHALKLINLDTEGLGGYRSYLARLGVLENVAYQIIQASGSFESRRNSIEGLESASALAVTSQIASPSAAVSAAASNALGEIVENIFRTIDRNNNGIINVEDAEKTLLRLNSRLGRRYGEDDVRAFFSALDVNNDGTLDLNEFKRAFLTIAS
jgi:hypothetical protein